MELVSVEPYSISILTVSYVELEFKGAVERLSGAPIRRGPAGRYAQNDALESFKCNRACEEDLQVLQRLRNPYRGTLGSGNAL